MLDAARANLTMLETTFVTDKGPVRETNEDSVAVVTPKHPGEASKGTMLIVADGLGGHEGGEIASRIVTSELPARYYGCEGGDVVENLVKALGHANDQIYSLGDGPGGRYRMGTTVVACVVVNQYLVSLNVGDSRAYVFRNGILRQLTEDHSLDTEVQGSFEGATRESLAHVLTRAVGPRPEVSPHISITAVEDGDLVLLCTDGLTGMVSDEEIRDVLLSYPALEVPRRLVVLAKQKGGTDNTTVIVARVVDVSFSDDLDVLNRS